MTSAISSLQMINRNLARSQAMTAADPQVKRDTTYYLAHIKTITSAKQLVGDYRLLSYATQAFGLSDMTYAKAFLEKVMEGGIANPKSMAHHLSDPRFRAFAAAFNFGDKGATATADAAGASAVVARYVEQTLEDNVGRQNAGAQLALYFQRQAPYIKNGLEILADKALFQFVQTAFDIATPSNGTSVETDAKHIESKVEIADLQDPAKVQKLVMRFAAMWDLKNSNPAASNPAVSILSGSGTRTSRSIVDVTKSYSQS